MEASREDGWRTQSNLARLGQLFLPRRGQPNVPGGGQPCSTSAASVVERQTPESRHPSSAPSSGLPASRAGITSARTHDGQPSVGESMSPLERKPDAGDSHVRFDERGVETQCRAGYSGTGNRKGRSPLRPGLNITAPLLDSTKPPGEGTWPTVHVDFRRNLACPHAANKTFLNWLLSVCF